MSAEAIRVPVVLVCADGTEIVWCPTSIPVGTVRLPVLTSQGYRARDFAMDVNADRLMYRERVALQ